MTLPFRRRHHDDEAGHDRARALTSARLLDPLAAADETWLTRHLDACEACRGEQAAFLADRELLRSLRSNAPEPPRDLWARTSAAIERESRGRRSRAGTRAAGSGSGGRGLFGRVPLAPAAGMLAFLVVFGSVLLNGNRITPPNASPGGSPVAVVTPPIDPTPFPIEAADVGYLRSGADGNWELIVTDVDEVCPQARPGCKSLGSDAPGKKIDLGKRPTNITISPTDDQLVIEQTGDDTEPGKVFVVPVPTATPPGTPAPTEPTGTVDPGFSLPITTAGPEATPGSTPSGGIEIATGVAMVGEAAYSDDGAWLAFSARPSDGSTGPDLYLWHVGDATAAPVTTDHGTYFSAWLGDRVLASRVQPAPPATPEPTAETASPASSDTPSGTEQPAESGPDATTPPATSPAATPPAATSEAHPVSFLLDPATLVQTDLPQPDVWLPVVDPTGRFVTYWSGTVVPDADGRGWVLGTGTLVLDGWSSGDGGEPAATTEPATTAEPEATADPAATTDPDATTEPAASQAPSIGPAGNPAALVDGKVGAFKVRFDPDGSRIAVWVGEAPAEAVGRLHLVVLDPETGAIDAGTDPLPGVMALRRFSIEAGRLAWVSPRGQDGQESSVQVLGWKGHDFGEIQTIPAKDLFIVR
jgi:hypothetical protein